MAEIIVTSTADSGAGSLRQAIADANNGDVILFDSDVFPAGETTSILLSSQIQVNKSVDVYGGESDGQGGYTSGATKRYYVYRDIDGVRTKTYITDDNPAQENETVLFVNVCRVALDGQGAVRCAYINLSAVEPCTFSGICFANGNSNGNTGGAIMSTSSSQSLLSDCSFASCVAGTNGGAIYSYSTSQNALNDCSFVNCTATTAGGVIYSDLSSQNNLTSCTFDGCGASNGGCFFSYLTSQNTLNDCIVYGCSATSNGGCVYSAGTSQNTLNDCIFDGCNAANGGGVYAGNTSQNTLNDCVFDSCKATSNGGGLYSGSTSQNTLNGCIISGCSATSSNGGGLYSGSTSQNTLNGCIISGCSATSSNGGAIYSNNYSQNKLNDCSVTNCSANYGGGVYSGGASQNTLTGCTFDDCAASTTGGGIISANTSQNTLNGCTFDASSSLYVGYTSVLTITGGITIAANLIIQVSGDVYPTITINDGAALTITTAATIGAATFTSAGRGYLATAAGINTSAATLTNVVLCAYGADVSSFAEVDGVLEWDAANPTTTVLIERADDDSWSTVTQTAGESLTLYLPPSDTVRLFDGERFFTAQAPDVRTYYYIGGSEGSFTSAADWSLRRGGVAITEPPVVAGQRFIVGDIAEDAQEE